MNIAFKAQADSAEARIVGEFQAGTDRGNGGVMPLEEEDPLVCHRCV